MVSCGLRVRGAASERVRRAANAGRNRGRRFHARGTAQHEHASRRFVCNEGSQPQKKALGGAGLLTGAASGRIPAKMHTSSAGFPARATAPAPQSHTSAQSTAAMASCQSAPRLDTRVKTLRGRWWRPVVHLGHRHSPARMRPRPRSSVLPRAVREGVEKSELLLWCCCLGDGTHPRQRESLSYGYWVAIPGALSLGTLPEAGARPSNDDLASQLSSS